MIMKRFILKRITIGITILLLSGGCSKSFLEQEIPGRASQEDFYKTDGDALMATTAAYDLLQAHYNWGWSSILMVKIFLSDESNAGGSGAGDQPAYQGIDKYNFDSQNAAVLGAWRMCYYGIYRANKVITYVKPETELRKRLIAECKVLRAYAYLDLVTMWGDVPLVLGDVPKEEYNKMSRTAKALVYAQITKDLGEAVVDLPLKSQYTGGDRFRVSRGTAQALLGRAYLYQEKWAQAAEQLNLVIQSGQYDLETSFPIAFARAGKFGIESLLEVSFSDKAKYDWNNFPWNNGRELESNINIQLMGPRSDYYKKAPADSLLGGWGFNTPKAKLFQAYEKAGDVKRRHYTIMSEAELKAAGGNWTGVNSYEYEGFFQRKYGAFTSESTSESGAIVELNYGTNWRLLRYADVLLMAAEAYYRIHDEDRARLELKKVKIRAGFETIEFVSGNDLFEAIVTERQLELAFEGYRFIDLVRWGRAERELGPLGFRKGTHEVLPIPDEDVKIAGLKQNDNY
jgi:hypothetical protein